jgi:hypothetical protein
MLRNINLGRKSFVSFKKKIVVKSPYDFLAANRYV